MSEALDIFIDDDEETDLAEVRKSKAWRDMDQRERFLHLVFRGYGYVNAGVEVGWSPAQTRKVLADPDFAALVDDVEDRKNESVERAVFAQARAGREWAAKLWLFNRRPDRWRDVRRIEVTQDTTVSVQISRSVAASVTELLRSGSVAALQPGGQLDEILDAEVVDVDGDG